MQQQDLDRLLRRTVGKSDIAGAVLHVSSGDGGTDLISSAGEIRHNSRYYIASINKLFMSALILDMASRRVVQLDDPFAAYVDDPVGHFARKTHFVGYDHHGHPLFGQRFHHVEHLPDHLRIQRRCGLVEQHHLRIDGQSAGDGDPLLLAARQLIRVNVGLVLDADLF